MLAEASSSHAPTMARKTKTQIDAADVAVALAPESEDEGADKDQQSDGAASYDGFEVPLPRDGDGSVASDFDTWCQKKGLEKNRALKKPSV